MLAEKAFRHYTHSRILRLPMKNAPLLAKWRLTLAHDGMTVHLQKQV